MKVYILTIDDNYAYTDGDYDPVILGIFSTKKKATEYRDNHRDSSGAGIYAYDMAEFTLDTPLEYN